MKAKEALQAKINEKEIKAEMKRTNICDMSITQSDCSRVTGIVGHITPLYSRERADENFKVRSNKLSPLRVRS